MSSREDALEREVARLEHARDLCVEELGHANERANRLLDRVTAAESERDAARAEHRSRAESAEALADRLAGALRECLIGGAFKHPQIVETARAALSAYDEAKKGGTTP